MYRPFVALVLVLGASACTDVTYNPPVAFRVELVSPEVGGISGAVAAVSQGRTTEAGIDLALPSEGFTVGWQISHGTCENPGEIVGGVGQYRDITADEKRRAEVVRTFLSELLQPEGRYHAAVVDPEDRSIVLVCGNMDRITI